jgi:phage tail-like protein
MPTATSNTPFLAKNFKVEIDNITTATFSAVSGLAAVIDVVDYRQGGALQNAEQKLPGQGSYPNIILTRGLVQDLSLWNWIHNNLTGTLDRRNIAITLLDQSDNPVWIWKLSNAFPCRWSGPDLVADSTAVATETLEICYEQLQSSLAT